MTSIRHNDEQLSVLVPEDDRYLDAARDAILAVGWSRTTLTDVARRAGVSRMTLYRRWPDMQTLLADLMTREWQRAVESALDGARGRTALRRLTSGLLGTLAALRENDVLTRIVDVDPELLLPYLLQRRGRSQELILEALTAAVREGQQDGSIRRGRPRDLARAVLLASHGFALSAHTMLEPDGQPRSADVSALDRELSRLVEGYLAP